MPGREAAEKRADLAQWPGRIVRRAAKPQQESGSSILGVVAAWRGIHVLGVFVAWREISVVLGVVAAWREISIVLGIVAA